MAVTFFDEYVPRTVARITDMDVANRLFCADQRDSLLRPFSQPLKRISVSRCRSVRLCCQPGADVGRFSPPALRRRRKKLPELERLPTNFYEDGIESLTHTLRLRQHLAMECWLGNRDVTMVDLILDGSTGRAGCGVHVSLASREPTRINWNFEPEVPARDFFESLDLSRSSDLTEAVEGFVHDMETDELRWESVIREEQGLATMLVLIDMAAELMSFDDPDADDPVHYIDGIERCSEPWYEILRRIAPQLTMDRLRTADVHDDILVIGWPQIATCVERSAEDVERRVTNPLEDSIRNVQDVKFVVSSSREGVSNILVRFRDIPVRVFDKRVNDLRREIQNKANAELPAETLDPEILEITTSNGFPTAMVVLTGQADDETLRAAARGVKEDVEQIPGSIRSWRWASRTPNCWWNSARRPWPPEA